MRAIILAAGSSRRFGDYLQGQPKCTLRLAGRSLLEHQVASLRAGGVTDFVVVRGYRPDAIQIPGARYYRNAEFATTNMVHSLFCAAPEIQGDVVIAYADIVYQADIIKRLACSDQPVSVAADKQWLAYYRARFDDPWAEAESFVVRPDGSLGEIGRSNPPAEAIQAQYLGLIRLNAKGAEIFRQGYAKFRARFDHQVWIRNRTFESAYMTDFLQALIDEGVSITPVPIENGWLEFDSPSDYERALVWEKEGTLGRFFRAAS